MFKRRNKPAAAPVRASGPLPQRQASIGRPTGPSVSARKSIVDCLTQAQGALRRLRSLDPGDLQAFPLLNEVQRLVQQLRDATSSLPPADREAWGYQLADLEDEFRELADIVVAKADAAPKPEPKPPSRAGSLHRSGSASTYLPPQSSGRVQQTVLLFSRQDGFTSAGQSPAQLGNLRPLGFSSQQRPVPGYAPQSPPSVATPSRLQQVQNLQQPYGLSVSNGQVAGQASDLAAQGYPSEVDQATLQNKQQALLAKHRQYLEQQQLAQQEHNTQQHWQQRPRSQATAQGQLGEQVVLGQVNQTEEQQALDLHAGSAEGARWEERDPRYPNVQDQRPFQQQTIWHGTQADQLLAVRQQQVQGQAQHLMQQQQQQAHMEQQQRLQEQGQQSVPLQSVSAVVHDSLCAGVLGAGSPAVFSRPLSPAPVPPGVEQFGARQAQPQGQAAHMQVAEDDLFSGLEVMPPADDASRASQDHSQNAYTPAELFKQPVTQLGPVVGMRQDCSAAGPGVGPLGVATEVQGHIAASSTVLGTQSVALDIERGLLPEAPDQLGPSAMCRNGADKLMGLAMEANSLCRQTPSPPPQLHSVASAYGHQQHTSLQHQGHDAIGQQSDSQVPSAAVHLPVRTPIHKTASQIKLGCGNEECPDSSDCQAHESSDAQAQAQFTVAASTNQPELSYTPPLSAGAVASAYELPQQAHALHYATEQPEPTWAQLHHDKLEDRIMTQHHQPVHTVQLAGVRFPDPTHSAYGTASAACSSGVAAMPTQPSHPVQEHPSFTIMNAEQVAAAKGAAWQAAATPYLGQPTTMPHEANQALHPRFQEQRQAPSGLWQQLPNQQLPEQRPFGLVHPTPHGHYSQRPSLPQQELPPHTSTYPGRLDGPNPAATQYPNIYAQSTSSVTAPTYVDSIYGQHSVHAASRSMSVASTSRRTSNDRQVFITSSHGMYGGQLTQPAQHLPRHDYENPPAGAQRGAGQLSLAAQPSQEYARVSASQSGLWPSLSSSALGTSPVIPYHPALAHSPGASLGAWPVPGAAGSSPQSALSGPDRVSSLIARATQHAASIADAVARTTSAGSGGWDGGRGNQNVGARPLGAKASALPAALPPARSGTPAQTSAPSAFQPYSYATESLTVQGSTSEVQLTPPSLPYASPPQSSTTPATSMFGHGAQLGDSLTQLLRSASAGKVPHPGPAPAAAAAAALPIQLPPLPAVSSLPNAADLAAYLNSVTGPVDECRAAAEERTAQVVSALGEAANRAAEAESVMQQQRRSIRAALASVIATLSQLEAEQSNAAAAEDFERAAALDEQIAAVAARRGALEGAAGALGRAAAEAADLRLEAAARQAEAWQASAGYLERLQSGHQAMAVALEAQAEREVAAAAALHRAAQDALAQRRASMSSRHDAVEAAAAEVAAKVAAAAAPAEAERQRLAEQRDALQSEVSSLRSLLAAREAALGAAEAALTASAVACSAATAAFAPDLAALAEARELLAREAAAADAAEAALGGSEAAASARAQAVAQARAALRAQAGALAASAAAMAAEAGARAGAVEAERRGRREAEAAREAAEGARAMEAEAESLTSSLAARLAALAEARCRAAGERDAAEAALGALQRAAPELEAAKRAAAAGKDFREAARLSGELRALAAKVESASGALSRASDQLATLAAAEAAVAAELEGARAQLRDRQREAAQAQHGYLLCCLFRSRAALSAAAAAERFEEAAALQAEAAEAEAEARQLEAAWPGLGLQGARRAAEEAEAPPSRCTSLEQLLQGGHSGAGADRSAQGARTHALANRREVSGSSEGGGHGGCGASAVSPPQVHGPHAAGASADEAAASPAGSLAWSGVSYGSASYPVHQLPPQPYTPAPLRHVDTQDCSGMQTAPDSAYRDAGMAPLPDQVDVVAGAGSHCPSQLSASGQRPLAPSQADAAEPTSPPRPEGLRSASSTDGDAQGAVCGHAGAAEPAEDGSGDAGPGLSGGMPQEPGVGSVPWGGAAPLPVAADGEAGLAPEPASTEPEEWLRTLPLVAAAAQREASDAGRAAAAEEGVDVGGERVGSGPAALVSDGAGRGQPLHGCESEDDLM